MEKQESDEVSVQTVGRTQTSQKCKLTISVALLTLATAFGSLCLLPTLNRCSLWVSHLTLHFDQSSNEVSTQYFDEAIQIISYFASDLRGVEWSQTDPKFDYASKSTYTFDYTSWCKDNSQSATISCYSGVGLNVIAGLVTDIGVQLGIAGHLANPLQFGENLAQTFMKTVEELDEAYHRASDNQCTTLDVGKLTSVHKVAESAKLGKAILILHLVSFATFVVFLSIVVLDYFTVVTLLASWARWLAISFLAISSCCTLVNYALEMVYLSRLNTSFRSFGAVFTAGLGSTLMVVQVLLGVLVTVMLLTYD